jgi:anti-sigma factor RsiW
MRRSGPVCRQVANLLGVYVLGGLRGQQNARVTAHLSACARCRAEYEELAEVPALLDLITAEEAAGADRPAGQAPVAHEKAEKPTEQVAFGGSEVQLPRRPVPPAG